jgi:hypothetical protein
VWTAAGISADAIELIQRGITELLDSTLRLGVTCLMTWLAVAQHLAGAYGEALGTA